MALQDNLNRLDKVIDQRLSREEAELRRADDAARADAQVRQRENAEKRRLVAERYDEAFRSFGTEVPAAVDDEGAHAYRKRLFNRLARRLPASSELAQVRADDVSGQRVVFDNFESLLLREAVQEGERPSDDNLPADGSLVMRTRTDSATGTRFNEFYGRTSFVKEMSRPGIRIERIVNPRTGDVLFGPAFDKR